MSITQYPVQQDIQLTAAPFFVFPQQCLTLAAAAAEGLEVQVEIIHIFRPEKL